MEKQHHSPVRKLLVSHECCFLVCLRQLSFPKNGIFYRRGSLFVNNDDDDDDDFDLFTLYCSGGSSAGDEGELLPKIHCKKANFLKVDASVCKHVFRRVERIQGITRIQNH